MPWPQQLLSFDGSSRLKNILCCLLPSLELSSAAVVVSGKALSRDLARRLGQRSLRCKRTLTGDRQERRGKEQLTCSAASVVRKLPNLQLCDFGSWSTSGKNSSWERSWNRSEAKLDKIYWSVNREKSVRGKMQRGVANLLGPILGVSKELF